LEEQKEIVRRVDALFAKADAIEQGYERLKTQIEQLPQAILAKAFKGELVPQLPSDGDAQALLEEIKQLKEAAAQAKKKSKKKPRTKKA
jgi:type I restriction enzyme S subunit